MTSKTDPAASPALETVRLVITGRVQGVGYRAWFEEEALELELSGWVRNRTDGSVEALVHGDKRKIEDLVKACHHGPRLSRVDKVTVEPAQWDGKTGFRVEKSV
jgi:acylphosphatase